MPAEAPLWIYGVVFGPLGLAAVAVGQAYLRLAGRELCKLGTPLGTVDWSFKESWASTITAVGALFGTIVSSTALPAATEVPKATWAGISFFFGVLVVVAPLVYAAFSKPEDAADKTVYRGTVGGFLAATVVTLWAVFGQLLAMSLIIWELDSSGALPPGAVWALAAVFASGGALIGLYADRRIPASLPKPCREGKEELAVPAEPSSWRLL